jgi:hypothetical protein
MFGYTLMNHSASMRTTSTFSVRTPMFSSLSLSANSFPPRRSIGEAPSRVASLIAAGVNVPVVMKRPLSAQPTIAPRKSRISASENAPVHDSLACLDGTQAQFFQNRRDLTKLVQATAEDKLASFSCGTFWSRDHRCLIEIGRILSPAETEVESDPHRGPRRVGFRPRLEFNCTPYV